MGGRGSGRGSYYGAKPSTDDYRMIDVRKFHRSGRLSVYQSFSVIWHRDSEVRAQINIESAPGRIELHYQYRSPGRDSEVMKYPVFLTYTECHFGGVRPWFLCPTRGCERRVACLYGGRIFACRQCHNLAYGSQREDAYSRAARKADGIRDKLGWHEYGSILECPGPKPKGMHWKTYWGYVDQYEELRRLTYIGLYDGNVMPDLLPPGYMGPEPQKSAASV